MPHEAPEQVEIRNVQPDDLPIFFEHQLDREAAKMAAFPSRERDAFIGHWTKILDNDNVIARTILFDEQVAGNIVSFVYDDKREVGYWLGREFWGKGITTRAVATFLEHDTTRPLYAHVAPHNPASIRVLEKCGFQLLGPGDAVSDADGEEIQLLLLELPDNAEGSR